MNEKAGPMPVGAAPAVDERRPEVAPHARLRAELAHGFWRDTPALSWLMQADTGELQFRAMHAGGSPAVNGATVHHEVLAGTLLRKVQRHGAQPLRMHEVLPGPDGQLHHFLIIGFPVGDGNGNDRSQPWVAGVAVDVTDHQRRMNELAHQALEDELTGLYNLRGFYLFAEHELKVARRRGTRSAILYVDVDGLKQVNDAQGHEGGNAALIATAALLRNTFRECDVIARLGGDEFAVFAADVQGDPELLRDRLRKALAAEAHAGAVRVSAGVGSSPADPALRLADLLASADQAMYKEKADKLARAPWAGKPG